MAKSSASEFAIPPLATTAPVKVPVVETVKAPVTSSPALASKLPVTSKVPATPTSPEPKKLKDGLVVALPNEIFLTVSVVFILR